MREQIKGKHVEMYYCLLHTITKEIRTNIVRSLLNDLNFGEEHSDVSCCVGGNAFFGHNDKMICHNMTSLCLELP